MKDKIINIIEREMEKTSNKTYAEYLKQLKKFLLNRKKSLENFEKSIKAFKDYLIAINNYHIGDLYTIGWCEFHINYNEEIIKKGKEISKFQIPPEELIKMYKKKMEELKNINYEEENEKELQKYTDTIISTIKEQKVQDISNYELTNEKIENKLKGETKELANILLEYLEIEKEEILKEIRKIKKD